MVLFSPKLDDSAKAFETIVFFSRPKDSFRCSHSLSMYHVPTIYQAMCGEWKVLWWTRQIQGLRGGEQVNFTN